jgi:cysteine dioxygenase
MKLESIDEILNYLNPNKKDLKRSELALESACIDINDLDEYLFWNDSNYTRNLIAKTEVYELYLCCWEPNQCSELHDLNGQVGWVKVLQGALEVKSVNKSDINNSDFSIHHLNIGDMYCHQSDQQVYAISNTSNKRVVSLHLTSLPVSFHNVLSGKGSDVHQIAVSYFSINGKQIA